MSELICFKELIIPYSVLNVLSEEDKIKKPLKIQTSAKLTELLRMIEVKNPFKVNSTAKLPGQNTIILQLSVRDRFHFNIRTSNENFLCNKFNISCLVVVVS